MLDERATEIVLMEMAPLMFPEDIGPFMTNHKIATRLERPKLWYPDYVADQRLHRLLEHLLSALSSDKIVANVVQTNGHDQHWLLFDCDKRLVYDASPLYGGRAHPLTAVTKERMCACRAGQTRVQAGSRTHQALCREQHRRAHHQESQVATAWFVCYHKIYCLHMPLVCVQEFG